MTGKKNKKRATYGITIPLSEDECYRLLSEEEFHWTFPDEDGSDVEIRVHIRRETQEDVE